MPRILAALVMFVLLIAYYIYKTQITEEKKVEPIKKVEEVKKVQKTVKAKPVSQKKKDFYNIMVPALNEVYAELMQQHKDVKELIQVNPQSERLSQLKKKYKVDNNQDLLVALKPHPKSIAIAQGAMESAWGTSRFFIEAYNMFGVWSLNSKEKRIAAGETRGSQTIWLRKYDSVKESVRDYYLTMSRTKAYKEFKVLNYHVENQNPYLLVKKLDRYSEKGALYGEELAAMISYNNLTQHDGKYYDKPIEPKKETSEKSVQEKQELLIKVVDSIQDNESSFGDILKDIKKEN